MARSWVSLRTAEQPDAVFLAGLWAEEVRRAEHEEQVSDLEKIIARAAGSLDQRIVVADYDGEPAGAVFLRLVTLTPLNLTPAVQVMTPCVVPAFRRHGVGRHLMEAAVTFAEEVGAAQIATAAEAGSRDANRFMARLGFAPVATYRSAATSLVRSRLDARRAPAPGHGRHLTKVLAARRSLRRQQESDGSTGRTAVHDAGPVPPAPRRGE